MKDHNFLRLVKDRNDPNLGKPAQCPKCKGRIASRGSSTTLVGGRRNHIHHEYQCLDCGFRFTHETKENGRDPRYDVSWYTTASDRVLVNLVGGEKYSIKLVKVIAGIPGCCSAYVWTCRHCGGDVVVKTFTDGNESGMTIQDPDQPHRTVYRFECQECHRHVTSFKDNWKPYKRRKKPQTGAIPNILNTPIYETIGVAAYNPRGIIKMNLTSGDVS